MNNVRGPYLNKILKELCLRVGADYDSIDFTDPQWYSFYTWEEKDQKDFKSWLIDLFHNNLKARKELLSNPYTRNKKHLEKCCNFFIFNYGWKLNYEK